MIKEVIVVEGKSDSKRLKSFFDVDTIETHGLGLKKETIDLIQEINKKRGVILLLDPDSAGEKIRRKINEEIKGLKNAFLLKKEGQGKRNIGIEYASKQALEKALNNLLTYIDNNNCLKYEDYYSLGLQGEHDSGNKREIISTYYNIGNCNSKTMYHRLNMLGVTYEQLKDVLNDSQH